MMQNSCQWKRAKIDYPFQYHTPACGESYLGIFEVERDEKALHQPYSADLALSDFDLLSSISHLLSLIFYLVGYIKQFLTENEFSDREILLEAVGHILEGIEKVILHRIVLAWMERLDRYITINEEYVE
jgi:hypothetical protein